MKKNIKTALVTGSNSSIGVSITEMLIKQGYFVYMNFNKNSHLIKNIKNEKILKIRADISKTNGIKSIFKKIRRNHNFLNLLVLNATRLDGKEKNIFLKKEIIKSVRN